MQNTISHAQFNVLGRIIAMSTSTVDLIGTCACAQEVQFKWILVADLGFFWQCVYPSNLRDASLSQRMGTSQAGQNKFTFFFAGCLSQIEMGLSTFIKFLPHSKRLI
jgi:hypothetical protein